MHNSIICLSLTLSYYFFAYQIDIALDLLKREGISAAIFAPGWVYETNQPPDFQTAQNR